MATGIIVDPSLWNYAGHHLTAVAGWVGTCRSAGLDCRILGNKECIVQSVEAVAVEKCFSGAFYHVAPDDPSEARVRLRIMQKQFRDDLSGSLKRIQSDDVVILAQATLVTLNGIAAWASGLPPARLPRLIVWLMTTPDDEEFVVPFGSTNCMVAAIDRLRKIFGNRLTLAGFTQEVCRRWKELSSEELSALPFISIRPELPAREDHVAASPPVIGFFGHLGPRKGLTLLPGIIRELERRKVEVEWRIAGECFDKESTAFLEKESLARTRSNVSFAAGPCGLDDYGRLLTTVDLLLLPYCPSYYEERGSGISEEAELVGLPYVAPKVAFSARAVAAGAAAPFERWSVEGIADAIITALSNLQDYSRAAETHSKIVRKQIQETRGSFLSPLLKRPSGAASLQSEHIDALPGVDIIVTLYNYRHFLNECLDSVRRQSYPNWRCLVVDDCSTDASFEEVRTLVMGFGEKFSYERHSSGTGQIGAISTGLALGSNPFVMLLDADDWLMENAIDVHLSWQLNKRAPVAVTSGLMHVVDEFGRLLAGCMDNIILKEKEANLTPLLPDDAFCRPGVNSTTHSAFFVRQNKSTIGEWFWGPTSGLMFRRCTMELVLPNRLMLGRYSADTFFALACHALGGSIVIDAPVAFYRRHGSNGFSDMAVYGADTMAVRNAFSTRDEVQEALTAHLRENYRDATHRMNQLYIDQVIGLTDSRIEEVPRKEFPTEELPTQRSTLDGRSREVTILERNRKPWMKTMAETCCTIGRALGARWLVRTGERLWHW